MRQLAIAVLIQHIWDRTSRSASRGEGHPAHRNWGLSQRMLPEVDRWANTFSAMVLDEWVNAYATRNGGVEGLFRGSKGVHRAALVLFMLWSIARFGSGTGQNQVRRQPSSLRDIPLPDLELMQKWWDLSLDSINNSEVNQRFEEAFNPKFSQILVDRCIARAAISCHPLPVVDLRSIADELDLERWADRLGGLATTCETLRHQAADKSHPTILITGPTTTGKSAVAWKLARLLGGVAIAADPFQICATPPIALGIGLAPNQPPGDIRSRLYRSQIPGDTRPSPEKVAAWIMEAVQESRREGLASVIEGGSVSAAMAICKQRIPTHMLVFDADVGSSGDMVRARLAADQMTAEGMLDEARAVRACGGESTWVVRESILYPRLFEVLDQRTRRDDAMSGIQDAWRRLVSEQQDWFGDLREQDGVVVLPPGRQTAEIIINLISGQEPVST